MEWGPATPRRRPFSACVLLLQPDEEAMVGEGRRVGLIDPLEPDAHLAVSRVAVAQVLALEDRCGGNHVQVPARESPGRGHGIRVVRRDARTRRVEAEAANAVDAGSGDLRGRTA